MAKLKIISQSLPTRCEVCHQVDEFDPLTGNCLRCSVVMVRTDLSTQTHQKTKYANIIRPKEIELQINNHELTLKYSTFDVDTIIGSIIFIVISGAMIYNGWLLVGIPLALVFIYVLLATIFNQRIIKLNATNIDIWEGPLPMGINQILPTRNIRRIFYKKGLLGDYQLKANLHKDEAVELLPNITTNEMALYFEQQLSRYLSLENSIDIGIDIDLDKH